MGRLDDLLARPATGETDAAERFAALLDAVEAAYIDDEIVLQDGQRVPYRMVLPDKAAQMAARIAADQALMERYGITKNESTADYFEEAQLIRILAEAVRDRDDPTQPLATAETLMKLGDVELARLAERYEDLRASVDPRDDEISPAEMLVCDELIKKNCSPVDLRQLFRSIGTAKLVSYVITTVKRLMLCRQGASCSTCGSESSSTSTLMSCDTSTD